jgi:hypothetical protein
MDVHGECLRLLAELDHLSGGRLMRRGDLGMLFDLGLRPGRRPLLDDLAFSAKFLTRARSMMERAGPAGQGYDQIAGEFSRHVQKAIALIRTLLEDAPEETAQGFVSRYLAATPEGLENLLALSADLGWYKNWLIDHGGKRSRPAS